MKIEVANLTDAARRIAARLPENPGGLPVRLGWDGKRIAVFSGTYSMPTKALPNERVEFFPGQQEDEIEAFLATIVARLVPAMRAALRDWTGGGRPCRGHGWRRLAGYGDGD